MCRCLDVSVCSRVDISMSRCALVSIYRYIEISIYRPPPKKTSANAHLLEALCGEQPSDGDEAEPFVGCPAQPSQVLRRAGAYQLPVMEVVAAIERHADMAACRPSVEEEASHDEVAHRGMSVARTESPRSGAEQHGPSFLCLEVDAREHRLTLSLVDGILFSFHCRRRCDGGRGEAPCVETKGTCQCDGPTALAAVVARRIVEPQAMVRWVVEQVGSTEELFLPMG